MDLYIAETSAYRDLFYVEFQVTTRYAPLCSLETQNMQ